MQQPPSLNIINQKSLVDGGKESALSQRGTGPTMPKFSGDLSSTIPKDNILSRVAMGELIAPQSGRDNQYDQLG